MNTKLLKLTFVAIALLSSLCTAGAKDLASGKGGDVVVLDISVAATSGTEEKIAEPEFIWNRSSRTWIKNPRHGLTKSNGSSQLAVNSRRK